MVFPVCRNGWKNELFSLSDVIGCNNDDVIHDVDTGGFKNDNMPKEWSLSSFKTSSNTSKNLFVLPMSWSFSQLLKSFVTKGSPTFFLLLVELFFLLVVVFTLLPSTAAAVFLFLLLAVRFPFDLSHLLLLAVDFLALEADKLFARTFFACATDF